MDTAKIVPIQDPQIRGIRRNPDGSASLCDGDDDCCPRVDALDSGNAVVTNDDGEAAEVSPQQVKVLASLTPSQLKSLLVLVHE